MELLKWLKYFKEVVFKIHKTCLSFFKGKRTKLLKYGSWRFGNYFPSFTILSDFSMIKSKNQNLKYQAFSCRHFKAEGS